MLSMNLNHCKKEEGHRIFSGYKVNVMFILSLTSSDALRQCLELKQVSPFAAHWLLSCEQRSLPCHVRCMHLPNCHPRPELCALTCALTSSATLAPFLGRALFNGCLNEEKLYNRGFPLKSTSLQKALLPLLPCKLACAFLLANPNPPSPLTNVSLL